MLQALQHRQGTLTRLHVLGKRYESLDTVRRELPQAGEGEPCPGQSREEALQTEDHHGFVPNQLAAFPKQITNGSFGFRINVAGGKQLQAEQVREPSRIVLSVDMFEATILRQCRGMGQVDAIARLHQPVDKPVPVIG